MTRRTDPRIDVDATASSAKVAVETRSFIEFDRLFYTTLRLEGQRQVLTVNHPLHER